MRSEVAALFWIRVFMFICVLKYSVSLQNFTAVSELTEFYLHPFSFPAVELRLVAEGRLQLRWGSYTRCISCVS